MFATVVILTTVFFVIYMKRASIEKELNEFEEDNINETIWSFDNWWDFVVDKYGLPFGQCCFTIFYSVFARFTLVDTAIFLVKYVPTGLYTFKFLKDMYATSRERIRKKKTELEDIQLQIQIVNTKLSVRDAEIAERAEQLRRSAERLRRVRARVRDRLRDVIAADDSLRRALDGATRWNDDTDIRFGDTNFATDEEHEFIVQLLKELKYDQAVLPERQTEKMERGEHAQTGSNTSDNSVYSSISDNDLKKDCRVKIVKVTNVYKVAYLKHYIKQKRLRRANKQAVLKKKMEAIKKLLEDWQNSLNMVINSKMSILSSETPPIDGASQEAMGDFSKPSLRETFESDSDLRNSSADNSHDEYSLNWTQNPYKTYPYNLEDGPETTMAREYYESQEYSDMKYSQFGSHQCECNGPKGSNVLFILPEETSSQLAIEEIKSETGDECPCQDLVPI